MKKMSLDLDSLTVESFATGGEAGFGTVRAYTGALCVEGDQSWDGGCGGGGTLNPGPQGCTATNVPQACGTQAGTCPNTCLQTCDRSCGGAPSECCTAPVPGGGTCRPLDCSYTYPVC